MIRMQRSASLIQEIWRSRGVWQRVFTIIRRLKTGQVFKKYGKKGNPHDRLVWMDEKLSKIYCCAEGYKDSKENKFIPITEVEDVVTGRGTEEFQRVKAEDAFFDSVKSF